MASSPDKSIRLLFTPRRSQRGRVWGGLGGTSWTAIRIPGCSRNLLYLSEVHHPFNLMALTVVCVSETPHREMGVNGIREFLRGSKKYVMLLHEAQPSVRKNYFDIRGDQSFHQLQCAGHSPVVSQRSCELHGRAQPVQVESGQELRTLILRRGPSL